MADGTSTALVVAGMAVVTYLTRAAGLFLVNRLRLTGRSQAFLAAIPGATLMAMVAPAVLGGGVPEWCGAAAVAAVSLRWRNLPGALAAGVAVVWAVRLIF